MSKQYTGTVVEFGPVEWSKDGTKQKPRAVKVQEDGGDFVKTFRCWENESGTDQQTTEWVALEVAKQFATPVTITFKEQEMGGGSKTWTSNQIEKVQGVGEGDAEAPSPSPLSQPTANGVQVTRDEFDAFKKSIEERLANLEWGGGSGEVAASPSYDAFAAAADDAGYSDTGIKKRCQDLYGHPDWRALSGDNLDALAASLGFNMGAVV